MPTLRSSPKEAFVFVSYRRRDVDTVTQLSQSLNAALGDEHVFFDLDDIHAGARWEALITTQVLASDVLVVAITEHWLEEFEVRRGDTDFVLREILLAMEEGIAIIPVVFPGLPPFSVDDLPPEIADLMERQMVHLTHDSPWPDQMQTLIEAVYALTPQHDKDVRRRKVNAATVMARWFKSADVDERVLTRVSGTRESDQSVVVSDRRIFLDSRDEAFLPVELAPTELFAACHEHLHFTT